MQALEGHGGHLTHIQFHSYGGGDGDENTFNSKAVPLAEYVNEHPNLTVDVGQVLFGETTSMTGDGPLGYYLSNIYKSKWFTSDTEMEAGCGIAPIEYKNKSLVHALQWAIGLEWYLLVDDPWRVAMSTDHPNGGSFLAYPQIIRLLMDRTWRQRRAEDASIRWCASARRWPIWTASTRCTKSASSPAAGPARILGLKNKGHLGPGADADITIYTPHENKETMFELPRYVIKAGQIIVETGEIRDPVRRQDAARRARLRPRRRGRHRRVVREVLLDPLPQLPGHRRLSARGRRNLLPLTPHSSTLHFMPLRLQYIGQTSVPVEVEGIVPAALRDKSLAEIERLEIFHGNQKLPLAEMFRVSGDPSDRRLEFEGTLGGRALDRRRHGGGGDSRRWRCRPPCGERHARGRDPCSGQCRRLAGGRNARRLDPCCAAMPANWSAAPTAAAAVA